MKYKFSKYNQEIRHKGGRYLYNFYTGAIAELPADVRGGERSLEDYSPEELSFLHEKGFVVREEVDEIKRLEFMHLAGKFQSSSLGLTVIPTLECNFACAYCYENGVKQAVMDKNIMDAVFSFADRKIRKDAVKDVHLHILGGEALLRPDLVGEILDRMELLRDKYGFSLAAQMITNGYFLDGDMIDRLRLVGRVRQVQVTFDGFGDSHDRVRRQRGGGGSFERILDNLRAAMDKGLTMVVRYNLTESNFQDAKKLLRLLGSLKKKPFIYFGHVKDYKNTESCKSVGCMTRAQYSAADLELMRCASDLGLRTDCLPALSYNHCVADTVNGYTVDPRGDLFKCWNDVGRKELSFGNILAPEEAIISREENFYGHILSGPFSTPCRECKLMPVCMGGCPMEREERKDKACSKYKFQSDEFAKIYLDACGSAR